MMEALTINSKISKRKKDFWMQKNWELLLHMENTFKENIKKFSTFIQSDTKEDLSQKLLNYYNTNINELRTKLLSGDIKIEDNKLFFEKKYLNQLKNYRNNFTSIIFI